MFIQGCTQFRFRAYQYTSYNLRIPCNLSHIIVLKYCYLGASLHAGHQRESASTNTQPKFSDNHYMPLYGSIISYLK